MLKQLNLSPNASTTPLKLFTPDKGPEISSVRPSVENLGRDQNFQNAVGQVLSRNPEMTQALDTFKAKLEAQFGSFEAALEHGSPEQFEAIIQSTDGLARFEKAILKEISGDKPQTVELVSQSSRTEEPRRQELSLLSSAA